jgi:hypothetical protein
LPKSAVDCFRRVDNLSTMNKPEGLQLSYTIIFSVKCTAFVVLRLIQNRFNPEEKCKGTHLVAEADT